MEMQLNNFLQPVTEGATKNTMTLAELNNLAQEIANKLGHISQELLLEIHALVHATPSDKTDA
jgi:hypothetical protein